MELIDMKTDSISADKTLANFKSHNKQYIETEFKSLHKRINSKPIPKLKGIVLAGGAGTRLYPITKAVPKSLLPLYNKPTIYYSLNTLKFLGCNEILIICQSQYLTQFQNLLQDGSQFGLDIRYKIQDTPNGIAEAFIIGEEFIGNDNVILCLGDNVFLMNDELKNFTRFNYGEFCSITEVKVKDSSLYGVYDKLLNKLIEKPKDNKYEYAIPGLYAFDHTVCEKAKSLKPSKRGELEITDLINIYLKKDKLYYNTLHSVLWVDTGTFNDLLAACNLIKGIEDRLGTNTCNVLFK